MYSSFPHFDFQTIWRLWDYLERISRGSMPDPPFNEYQPGPGRGDIFVNCAALWAAVMLGTTKKKMSSH
jgi:hypothetical protein